MLAHPEKIDWGLFSYNLNYQAVEYLLAHPDKINKINKIWYGFSTSQYVFVLDKEKMRTTKYELHQDLINYFLHPSKIEKWINSGQDVLDYPYFQ